MYTGDLILLSQALSVCTHVLLYMYVCTVYAYTMYVQYLIFKDLLCIHSLMDFSSMTRTTAASFLLRDCCRARHSLRCSISQIPKARS